MCCASPKFVEGNCTARARGSGRSQEALVDDDRPFSRSLTDEEVYKARGVHSPCLSGYPKSNFNRPYPQTCSIPAMVPSALVASLLASALLVSPIEAATINGLFKPSGHFAKGTARRDTGWGGRAVDIESRDDGCPIGWAECSYFTCYPLDGSVCCSDGNFCDPGYYCDGGGCCREGRICSGGAPPPSTIGGFTTTSTRRFTSATAGHTTTSTSFDEFPRRP
ncbi:hypothetical protein C8T65DRAFT_234037 [Cerioporus squamosus]|nr:hypothetical protein C8T65DRAFT_234037 [Cerioporus squamosus]